MKLPAERGVDYIFDWNEEQPFAFLLATNPLTFAAGFLLSVGLALIRQEAYVAGVLAGVFSLSTIVRLVAGLGFIIVTDSWIFAYSVWITTPQVC
jgi:hypothetical protein